MCRLRVDFNVSFHSHCQLKKSEKCSGSCVSAACDRVDSNSAEASAVLQFVAFDAAALKRTCRFAMIAQYGLPADVAVSFKGLWSAGSLLNRYFRRRVD
jgi:hypothetical protein